MSSPKAAFRAAMLTLPGEGEIAQTLGRNVDPDAIHEARMGLMAALGKALEPVRVAQKEMLTTPGVYRPDATDAGKRALKNAMAILGSVIFAIGVIGLDAGIFWSKLQTGVYFGKDFMGGFYKSIVFGGTVSLIAVYFGYSARPTGAGVGTATTNPVVLSSVLILVFDFIMTSFLT